MLQTETERPISILTPTVTSYLTLISIQTETELPIPISTKMETASPTSIPRGAMFPSDFQKTNSKIFFFPNIPTHTFPTTAPIGAQISSVAMQATSQACASAV